MECLCLVKNEEHDEDAWCLFFRGAVCRGAFNPPPPRQKIAKEREFIFLTRPAICLLGLNEINPSNKARWQLAQCTMHHAELNLEY